MHVATVDSLVERGLKAAESRIFEQNKIWACHASEKPDVSVSLMKTIRALHSRLPHDRELSALAIGAGDEPQFRVLQAAFQRGLWLYDVDGAALAKLRERIDRQAIDNVYLVQGDYGRDFQNSDAADFTRETILDGRRLDLVTLHHCLYYYCASEWPELLKAIYQGVLAPKGAMHLVMMSTRETRPGTTTWLYNHFAEKFSGSGTDQDLLKLPSALAHDTAFKHCEVVSETREVEFWVDDFERFMAVVWMILLYPHGHDYSLDQRVEITEFVIEHFWRPGRPLVQTQDYLSLHKLETTLARDPLEGVF
jgi:hypothetical protein